jgi:hypothetical protein
VSDLNFLAFVYYVPTKTWMSSVLFDHISACRIVFRSKIVIAVIHFGNVFNSAKAKKFKSDTSRLEKKLLVKVMILTL